VNADIHVLSGAYALDALEDDVERRRFERHLAECEPCRIEVRSLRETAAVLTEAVATQPSPAFRSRVLDRVATTPQLPPAAGPAPGTAGSAPGTAGPPGREDGRRNWRLGVAAATVALLAGAGLAGVGAVELRRARESARQDDRILAIVADPAARRASGAVTGGGSATVVVAGDRAVVLTAGVRALAGDRAYQLWLVRPGQVVSAGLGPSGDDAGGAWSRLVDGVRAGDVVAVSVEPAGGSRQPTTTPLTTITI
jgi:anti-sigma-K factor RskA